MNWLASFPTQDRLRKIRVAQKGQRQRWPFLTTLIVMP
jgi:hypothetical protein